MARRGWLTMPAWNELFPPAPAPGTPGDPGLFGPSSAAWRIGRERLLVLGGPTALLLQVAHPLVAAGVAEHSDFTTDPLRRLRATLDAALTVSFGDHAQVAVAVAAVSHRHRPVIGDLAENTGRFAAGTRYRAGDPALALWVHATLIWTAVRTTETFRGPIPPAVRDAYCREMRQFGRLFGAAEADLPADFASLDDYLQRALDKDVAVGPVAHRLARQILAPEPPLVPAPLQPLTALLAAGLLPARTRADYQLAWRRREQHMFASLAAATRTTVPVLPPPLRFWPHYRVARRRIAAQSQSGH